MKSFFSKALRQLGYLTILLLIVIASIEVGFRIARNAGWFGLDYGDVFSQEVMNEGGFLIPSQNVQVINGYGEKVPWITNSKGFRNNMEFAYNKPNNTIRILSIGDSFAAGYRVGQGDTYSSLIEEKLNKTQDSVSYEIIVANVLNPVIGLEFLRNYGLKYKPDIVILGVTLGNDLSESLINLHEFGKKKLVKGVVLDNENFNKEELKKSVLNEQFPKNAYQPASELNDLFDRFIFPKIVRSILKSSYQGESNFAIRGKVPPFIHDFTHGLGLYLKDAPNSVKMTFVQFKEVLEVYSQLSDSEEFDLYICLFPQRFQVNELDTKKTIKDYFLNEEQFDWNLPNKIIAGYCDLLNLNCIDGLVDFKNGQEIMYLPNGDMHWNPKGHMVMSKVLMRDIWGVEPEK